MHIDVRANEEPAPPALRVEDTSKHLIIWLEGMAGESVDVFVGEEPVFTATVGRRGDIRVAKSSEMAKRIIKRMKRAKRSMSKGRGRTRQLSAHLFSF